MANGRERLGKPQKTARVVAAVLAAVAAACQPQALTYEQLQASKDSAADAATDGLAETAGATDALAETAGETTAETHSDTQPAPDGDAAAEVDTGPKCPASCDDDKPCTADSCGPNGICLHVAAAGSCDDGNLCTEGDTCSGDTCTPGASVTCDDKNVCTTDLCDPKVGCTATNNGKDCDDGIACTTGDLCSGGQCKGTPKVWQAVLGSKYVDHGNAIVAHSDGGVVAAGRHGGNVEDDFWLARFGAGGDLLWQKQYGEPDVIESCYGLAAMAGGGWLMAGAVGAASATDGRAVRVDGSGKVLWAQDVGTAELEEFRGVVALGDGGAVAVGKSSKSASSDLWLVRFTGEGAVSWQANLGGTAAETGYALVSAPGGGLLAVGTTTANTSMDALVVRTDAKGAPLWQKVLGDSSHTEHAMAVAQAPGGGFLVVGDSVVSGGNSDLALWYLSDSGQLLWSQLWGNAETETGTGVVALSDGLLMTGRITAAGSTKSDGLLVRFDPLGNFLWKKVLGGGGADSLVGITKLSSGFALVGDSPNEDGSAGMWVVRTDQWGYADCANSGLCKAPCNSSSACKISWCELGNCTGSSIPEGGWCMESPCLAGTCDEKKSCTNSAPVSCDDGNPCTTDGCSTGSGCSHAQVGDGMPCASGSVCKAGSCVAGQ